MKLWKTILPGALLAGGVLFMSVQTYATPAMAKKENGAKCTSCHVAAGKKDLNDTGKCYKTSKNLAACAKK